MTIAPQAEATEQPRDPGRAIFRLATIDRRQ
jgi:hypothetical protein